MHNIIIYQLEECKDNDKVICNRHDRKQILEICSQLSDGYIKESSIKSIFRLGVRSDKVRPVIVKFYDKRNRNIVRENLKKIKGLSSSLRCIGVNYDLNKKQREKRKELVIEAKKLQADSNGGIPVSGKENSYKYEL
ncbi:hypothetical protein HELRODRAFT_158631 [Helobdella robusta]|uniref:Uncharacterized protein n=1 Tax=Helobdella robusta TaxID=6412 RepID=T1EN16_HELRO|nr:hypothetical protein HELRODRAFT_158631 [Helobdella robusta]ESO12168.1 hypothetical protein HELRODRAFT_158631 [Helobdella robusta]